MCVMEGMLASLYNEFASVYHATKQERSQQMAGLPIAHRNSQLVLQDRAPL